MEPDIDAWIVAAVRTPRGRDRADGALHDVVTMCTGGGMGTATIVERA